MRRFRFDTVLFAAALVVLNAGAAHGQQAPPAPSRPDTLLKVEVVLSRWQAEKKTSSLPFTLWVNVAGANGFGVGNLRVGVDVPVGAKTTVSASTTGRTTESQNNSTTTTGTNTTTEYRNVGTSIDCTARALADGRFTIDVRVQDSSIFAGDTPARGASRSASPAAFRTFSTSNTLPMRDGQTTEFAKATDKITGETLKVDVTMNVMKEGGSGRLKPA